MSSYPTVSNKKTQIAVFETCVFRLYLRNHLNSKKISLYFKSGHKISWYLQKRCFARKKVNYQKKSAILKKSKTFFQGPKV